MRKDALTILGKKFSFHASNKNVFIDIEKSKEGVIIVRLKLISVNDTWYFVYIYYFYFLFFHFFPKGNVCAIPGCLPALALQKMIEIS